MASDTINFSNVRVNQAVGSTTLNGSLTVNYDNQTVSGFLTDGAGTQFNNFALTTADGGATYTLQGGGGLLATVSANYAGQSPTTTTVTYTSIGLLPAITNNVPVISAIIPCFVTGTLIRTTRGDVAVEKLMVGDVAVTASGHPMPIKWLSNGKVNCELHPRPNEVRPIRIAAHAFGADRPARDLYVSPGHSICLDVVGEVLIPACCLINGSTITQVSTDIVTYWHVEVERHDILLAENLPAESYLDMGNRNFFHDANVVDLKAGPDTGEAQLTHADFCRPFHNNGPIVNAVKAQLINHAKSAGWSLTRDIPFHLEVDGKQIYPVIRASVARFHVPADAKDVWLVSPTARPSDLGESEDTRDLGLCIGALSIDEGFGMPRDIAIADPLLSVGFHRSEGDVRRWTAGRAKLPPVLWLNCANDFYLRVEFAGLPVPHWTAPVSAQTSLESEPTAIAA